MHWRTGMPPPLLEGNAHIRKAIHLEYRPVNHFAHEIVHPLIVAWGHAQNLAQAINGEDLDAPVHIGFELDPLVGGRSRTCWSWSRQFRPRYGPMLA